jgi:hypothetical protein
MRAMHSNVSAKGSSMFGTEQVPRPDHSYLPIDKGRQLQTTQPPSGWQVGYWSF